MQEEGKVCMREMDVYVHVHAEADACLSLTTISFGVHHEPGSVAGSRLLAASTLGITTEEIAFWAVTNANGPASMTANLRRLFNLCGFSVRLE